MVTAPVLGAVVRELVGDAAPVEVLVGNGTDPHDWQPSARDIEALQHARIAVVNGCGLEEALGGALDEARADGVPVFDVSRHVALRMTGDGGDAGCDPHYWTDPLRVEAAVLALAPELASVLDRPLTARGAALAARLEALDAELRSTLEAIPPQRRTLVTGHESLAYFAERYGLEVAGAVIPGFSPQAGPSAAALAQLEDAMAAGGVTAVFTELGTPSQVARTIAQETGAEVVELPSHTLPADGSYFTYMRDIAAALVATLARGVR